MNIINKIIQKIDSYQRTHAFLGFPYAVIKKYSDDEGGYQTALVTYYGFLSLFPLLLVVGSLLQLIVNYYPNISDQVKLGITKYFPILGTQLESNIHSPHKSGIILVIALLFTLYGAKGGADAFQHVVYHVWNIVKKDRAGFPTNLLHSISIMGIGGLGFLISVALSAYFSAVGHLLLIHIMSIILSTLLLGAVFVIVFTLILPKVAWNDSSIITSAICAAIGIQILQYFGGILLSHQLKNLNNLYGTFAIVLGLIYWIYLQLQVVIYSIEVGIVHKKHLWPRAINQEFLTPADKQAYALQAQKENIVSPEHVKVKFDKK
ncbi:MAG: hypothetical protein NVSMB46_05870 [Candidatus Saccharimonadales bacterium]